MIAKEPSTSTTLSRDLVPPLPAGTCNAPSGLVTAYCPEAVPDRASCHCSDGQAVVPPVSQWQLLIVGLGLLVIALLPEASASDSEAATASSAEATMLLVIGEPGTDEYARLFDEWAGRWEAAAELGDVAVTTIGRGHESDATDYERLQAAVTADQFRSARSLWIVLIGHGTFDGRTAKFNLRKPDVTATEMAEWLAGIDRPLAVVNCASASAPFINRLSGPNRVIVTATRSGAEANFARFGDYLSQAITDTAADLDKDGQVSLLEAFLTASRSTESYYEGQRQLATEHALLEDNGDARGVRAEMFSGIHPAKQAEAGSALDGRRAHQWHLVPSDEERRLPPEVRRRRDELELQLAELRDRKSEFAEDDYYARIEPLLLEIARLYESVEVEQRSPESSVSE